MKPSEKHGERPEKDVTSIAVEWVLEKQEGFAPGRAEAFRTWCAADPSHALAVAKAEGTLGLLGELADLKEPLGERLAAENEAEPVRSRGAGWRRAFFWSAAAAAAFALVSWRWPTGSSPEFNYVSNAGRPQQVALEDGSLVDLNSNTTIRAQLRSSERRVSLREGEAHFSVAHDSSRPFIVEAGGISIRAVGTAFNVRVNEKGVEVLVLEGRVEVSRPESRSHERSPSRPQLVAGDQAIVRRDGPNPELVIEKADTQTMQRAVAWHSSVTTISNRPLREIVDLFNRHNQVHLVIADAEVGDRSLGGSFSINQPQAFARLLELEGDIVAEHHGENEILLRRKH